MSGFEGDLDEVVRRLRDVHPDFVQLVGEDAFAAAQDQARQALAGADDPADVWWSVAPLVAAGGDGHTVLWPPAGDTTAPWTLRVDAAGVWVLDWGGCAGPALPSGGARLVSVEGLDASALAGEIGARFGAETDGFRHYRVETEAWRALPIAVEAHGVRIGAFWNVEVEHGGRRRAGVVALDPPAWRTDTGYVHAWFADPPAGVRGAEVHHLLEGGAAEGAGLRTGDLVTALDGVAVMNAASIWEALDRVDLGQTVVLDVRRGDDTLRVPISAGRWRSWSRPWWFLRLGDTVWIDLDGFADPDPFEAALDQALDDTVRHVIVDLRHDDGGDAQMPELLCARLCRHLPPGFTMTWRHSREANRDQRRQWRPFGPFADAFAPRGTFFATRRGQSWTWLPTPHGLSARPFDGQVDVLVDGGTYSAGVYAAHLLGQHAGARIVGEPPGSGPRFHAHALSADLPESGLSLQISSATFAVRGAVDPVVPDLATRSADALHAALADAAVP